MKTIEQIHEGTLETDGEWQPIFESEEKDFVTPILEKHAAKLSARIQEALNETDTSFAEMKERYQEQDWTEVAEDIWEALNEIDDSPVGQLIHGAVYGVTEQAIEIFSAIYDKVAERFGETLTTTINDQQSFDRLVDPIIKEVQSNLDEGLFDAYWRESAGDPTEQQPPRQYYEKHEPDKLEQFDKEIASFIAGDEPPPALVSSSPDKPLSPLGGESLKDYLEAIPRDNSQSVEVERGIER